MRVGWGMGWDGVWGMGNGMKWVMGDGVWGIGNDMAWGMGDGMGDAGMVRLFSQVGPSLKQASGVVDSSPLTGLIGIASSLAGIEQLTWPLMRVTRVTSGLDHKSLKFIVSDCLQYSILIVFNFCESCMLTFMARIRCLRVF